MLNNINIKSELILLNTARDYSFFFLIYIKLKSIFILVTVPMKKSLIKN